jgi:GntR family transcriptional regulator, transcriptional repressor for pyruvate dehydrogenase complex
VRTAAVVFEQVHLGKINSSERIATAIEKMMMAGKLRAGDRLPPERQLARDFRVNRATLREAIHVLQERGLVDRKNRTGTRVASVKPSSVGAAIERFFLLNNCRHSEMHEVRCVLEPQSAALAAKNAKSEDLQKLKELVIELEECWSLGDARRLASTDVQFHLALAAASHNSLIGAIFIGLTPILEKFLYVQHSQLQRPKSFAMHREIYEAVVAGDSVRAGETMARHMRTTPAFK